MPWGRRKEDGMDFCDRKHQAEKEGVKAARQAQHETTIAWDACAQRMHEGACGLVDGPAHGWEGGI